MADLPKDTLYDIFSRLPVESLARFRCVCKPWCNYIDDPYLVSIHVNEPILMMLNGQCATLPKQLGLGIGSNIEPKEGNTVFEVKQDPLYRFESKGGTILDIGVCNGMILFHQHNFYSTSCYLVIHPLRKERYELPFVDLLYHPSYVKAYGLGFDDSTKTFKVVFLFNSRPTSLTDLGNSCTMVHVLGTYSWRKIPQIPDDCSMIKGQGVFVKGLLYWAINLRWPGTHGDVVIHNVIYFDVTKEEFGSIDPPPDQQ
uniref:putative F-box/kelch-repeat protein At3g17570 n=1 Tax=Erigeron canadensis TaxID=72917 RepID=UPI001CB92B6A|nr:putative F-box/kelch-repeat protein At3g17570 [Erigeron canadensis]